MSSLPIGEPRLRVSSVIDASAILAMVFDERGTERVSEAVADDGWVSAVNLAEVITRMLDKG